jgi:hypothetical protein
LRQTTVPTVITSLYIVFLGSYRALYLVNWILREFDTNNRPPNTISVIFGIIQTALYADFAWVYWTRQRVKLRNGGVVDADDMRRGWLLSRIFGGKQFASQDHTDEENSPFYNDHQAGRGGSTGGRGGASRAKWGSRGISVSADEGVLEHEASFQDEGVTDVDPDARMQDPDELARALDEDEDDAPPPVSKNAKDNAGPSGIRNGDEWDDD